METGLRFTDFISLIIDNLSRRKGRVLLTAIGVVIGTAAVVTLVSLGVGLQQSATSQLWGINDLTSIEVYPGYPMAEGPMMQQITEDDIKKLTPDAVESFKAIPGCYPGCGEAICAGRHGDLPRQTFSLG